VKGEPAVNQSEYSAVSPKNIGSYVHGLTNNVDIFAYKHNEEEPEKQANHQPIVRDAYGSIANAEANLKNTESPVTNPGLTAEKSQKFSTKATGAVLNPKEAEAAAAAEVEGAKEALMQIRNRGDDVPKGFQNIDSVKGPDAGAPIGAAVHKLAIKGGEPYARDHLEAQPENGVQHQPFLFREADRIKEDAARPKSLNPGVTAIESATAKTTGTGALKNPKEAEAVAASEAAPVVEPKRKGCSS